MRLKLIRAAAPLTAVLALGAVASASASAALPEFTGPFPSAYESVVGESSFETTSGHTLACRGGTASGMITGAKTLTQNWTLTGCNWNGPACNTAGAKEGEIQIKSIKGTLVYLVKATKEAGIAYNPYEPKTLEEGLKGPSSLAAVKCSTVGTVELRRTLLAHIGPVNTATTHFEPLFQEIHGHQEPSSYENEGQKWSAIAELSHSGSAFESAAFGASEFLTTSRTIEIKA